MQSDFNRVKRAQVEAVYIRRAQTETCALLRKPRGLNDRR